MKLTPELPTVWRLFPRSGRSASVLPATFTQKFANATPDIGSRTRTIHCAPLHTIPTIKRNVFNHVASSFTQSRATRFPCNSSSRKLLKITNAVNVQTHFYLMAPILGLTASSPSFLNWPFDQLGFIRPLAHSTPSRCSPSVDPPPTHSRPLDSLAHQDAAAPSNWRLQIMFVRKSVFPVPRAAHTSRSYLRLPHNSSSRYQCIWMVALFQPI